MESQHARIRRAKILIQTRRVNGKRAEYLANWLEKAVREYVQNSRG